MRAAQAKRTSRNPLARFSLHSENIAFYLSPAGGSLPQGRSTGPKEPEIELQCRELVSGRRCSFERETETVAAEQMKEASLESAP